ncbi:MFS transporter [Yinghuangia aomiensis]
MATPAAASATAPALILPDIASSLAVSTTAATWVVVSFAMATAIGNPLMAALIRRHGLPRVLGAGTILAVLGVFTVACAPNLPLLLAGRAMQALGSTALAAVAMNLAGTVRRMGVITAGFAFWGGIGPLTASLLSAAVSWQLALSASGIALAGVPMVMWHLRRMPDVAVGADRFDARGATLVAIGVSALVLAPRYPRLGIGLGAAAAVVLAWHVRRRPSGFVPRDLLRDRIYLGATSAAAALATAHFGLLYALPLRLRDTTDWTATTIGITQMSALLTGAAASLGLTAASARMGRRPVITVLVGCGLVAPATSLLVPWSPVLVPAAALGAAAAFGGLSTLGVLVSHRAPPPLGAQALGLLHLSYQLGAALGPFLAVVTFAG